MRKQIKCKATSLLDFMDCPCGRCVADREFYLNDDVSSLEVPKIIIPDGPYLIVPNEKKWLKFKGEKCYKNGKNEFYLSRNGHKFQSKSNMLRGTYQKDCVLILKDSVIEVYGRLLKFGDLFKLKSGGLFN